MVFTFHCLWHPPLSERPCKVVYLLGVYRLRQNPVERKRDRGRTNSTSSDVPLGCLSPALTTRSDRKGKGEKQRHKGETSKELSLFLLFLCMFLCRGRGKGQHWSNVLWVRYRGFSRTWLRTGKYCLSKGVDSGQNETLTTRKRFPYQPRQRSLEGPTVSQLT